MAPGPEWSLQAGSVQGKKRLNIQKLGAGVDQAAPTPRKSMNGIAAGSGAGATSGWS